MKPNDELRGAYQEFLRDPIGRDFLMRLNGHETDLQLKAYRAETMEQKASYIDEMKAIYYVRTLLADLSAPAPARRGQSTLASTDSRKRV